jgi:hypothetical protein
MCLSTFSMQVVDRIIIIIIISIIIIIYKFVVFLLSCLILFCKYLLIYRLPNFDWAL